MVLELAKKTEAQIAQG